MPYGRRLTEELTAEQRDSLAAADWDGTDWVVPFTDFEVLRSLAAAALVDERRGRWVLTLKGHRRRQIIGRPEENTRRSTS